MVWWIDTSLLFSPAFAFPFILLSDLFKPSTMHGSGLNFSALCQDRVGSVALSGMVLTYFLKPGELAVKQAQ